MNWLSKLLPRKPSATPLQLLAYATDKAADIGGRDDAILALSDSDLPEVEEGLLQMATDSTEEEMLVDQAGHALWIVWARQGKTPTAEVLSRMPPSARKFFEHDL